MVSRVRIPSSPPPWNISANPVRRRSYAIRSSQRPDQLVMRPHDADFVLGDLDPLREPPQMVAPKSAVLSTHAAAAVQCEELLKLTTLEGPDVCLCKLEPFAVRPALRKSTMPICLDTRRIVSSDRVFKRR